MTSQSSINQPTATAMATITTVPQHTTASGK